MTLNFSVKSKQKLKNQRDIKILTEHDFKQMFALHIIIHTLLVVTLVLSPVLPAPPLGFTLHSLHASLIQYQYQQSMIITAASTRALCSDDWCQF